MTAAEIIAEHPDLPLEELGRTSQLNLEHIINTGFDY
jgi:hypothetical protein